MKWILVLLVAHACSPDEVRVLGSYSTKENCYDARKELESRLNHATSICSEANDSNDEDSK